MQTDASRTIVTLDGPAGSGKSTTAREVARRLGYRYLDSGALYRMLTFALLRAGVATERWAQLSAADLAALPVAADTAGDALVLRYDGQVLDRELRTPEVNRWVPEVARLSAVREWLLDTQRALGRHGRLVADGRDMGTVVFPEAGTKVFVQADLEERARRRLRDLGHDTPSAREVKAEAERLAQRDDTDRSRETAPLTVPDGAVRLDTTDLDFEEQVARVVALARAVDPDSAQS